MEGYYIELRPSDGIAQVFTEGRHHVERAARAFRKMSHRKPRALLVESCGRQTDIGEFLSEHA